MSIILDGMDQQTLQYIFRALWYYLIQTKQQIHVTITACQTFDQLLDQILTNNPD